MCVPAARPNRDTPSGRRFECETRLKAIALERPINGPQTEFKTTKNSEQLSFLLTPPPVCRFPKPRYERLVLNAQWPRHSPIGRFSAVVSRRHAATRRRRHAIPVQLLYIVCAEAGLWALAKPVYHMTSCRNNFCIFVDWPKKTWRWKHGPPMRQVLAASVWLSRRRS